MILQEIYRHVTNPETRWTIPPVIEELKKKARQADLWNLFLPGVSGFSQLEYAPMAEVMGRCPFASEIFNCSAPDTGMSKAEVTNPPCQTLSSLLSSNVT